MTLKTYDVTLRGPSGERLVRVAAEIDVQAGDAAASLMAEDEAIVGIARVDGDPGAVQAGPPLSQAAEFAGETQGAAASDAGRPPFA